MMQLLKVSVVVPVYNVEKYLDRCIDSLVNQTLEDIEIILVDDGSPDNCPKLCDQWALKDSRIRVFHKQNEGLGYTRNFGMEKSCGEYVCFVDSDDYIDADMLEIMYNTAIEHSAEFAITGYKAVGGIMFEEKTEYIPFNFFDKTTLFKDKEEIDNLMLSISGALPEEREDSRYGFSSCRCLYKAEVIKKNSCRFLSERRIVSEDVLFLLDFINCINCAVGIPGMYYNYCRNEGSISKSYRADRFEKNKILISEINKRLSQRMSESKYKIYTDRFYQSFARVACVQEIMYSKQNNVSKKELSKRLKEICSDDGLKKVLKNYPIKKLPLKQAVFAYAMKFSLTKFQLLLVYLRK